MKTTYKLMGNETTSFQVYETEGREVTIQGFEDIRFIVHTRPGGWTVSELTTGLRITRGHTRDDAVESAKSVLDEYSKEHVHEVLGRAKATMTEWGAYPLNP